MIIHDELISGLKITCESIYKLSRQGGIITDLFKKKVFYLGS
jgi:hypothetical protein